jgi:hypothetical protein
VAYGAWNESCIAKGWATALASFIEELLNITRSSLGVIQDLVLLEISTHDKLNRKSYLTCGWRQHDN